MEAHRKAGINSYGWTATESSVRRAGYRWIGSTNSDVNGSGDDKAALFSVRCVENR